MLRSNIVPKNKLREVQAETLGILAKSLTYSFGPMGSNSTVMAKSGVANYTKDGHSILKSIRFTGEIETGIRNNIEELTRYIALTVGDGTTSAVLLSNFIFNAFKAIEEAGDKTPYEIIKDFKAEVEEIKKIIKSKKKVFTPDAAYNIAYVATNGDVGVAENLRNIYRDHGNEVYIDYGISMTEDSLLKTYDGMTFETGYSDNAYINNLNTNSCIIKDAHIYYFEDPIDTREMLNYLDKIISTNIIEAYNTKDASKIVPTVVICPKLSMDMAAYVTGFVEWMLGFDDVEKKPPFLLITNYHQYDMLSDIIRMCGCKPIRKYNNTNLYEADVEKGLAPTVETVCNFYGHADIVEADLSTTKFINPLKMHDEYGELSNDFKMLTKFLESELAKAKENSEDANTTGQLKRRLNSLKANMVEYLVGGISIMDRDSLKDLIEDAILNCRSAAKNGYGYGSNYEGLMAVRERFTNNNNYINSALFKAYEDLFKVLCQTANINEETIDKYIIMINDGNYEAPLNILTKECDENIVSSIDSDVVILDAISKIVSLILTSNQFLCTDCGTNSYAIFE